MTSAAEVLNFDGFETIQILKVCMTVSLLYPTTTAKTLRGANVSRHRHMMNSVHDVHFSENPLHAAGPLCH